MRLPRTGESTAALLNWAMALSLILAFLVLATPALANDLDSARAQGLVGERYDGLAVALDSSAAGLVQQVNQKRLAIYNDQAQQQGVSVEAVGRVFAEKIMAKAPPGTAFQNADGSWVRK